MSNCIDHLHFETEAFDATCRFWSRRGLRTIDEWQEAGCRACRLGSSELEVVVVETASPLTEAIYLAAADGQSSDIDLAAEMPRRVEQRLRRPDWNRALIPVADPDGRVFWLEERATDS